METLVALGTTGLPPEIFQAAAQANTPLVVTAVLLIGLSVIYLAVVNKHKGEAVLTTIRNYYVLSMLAIILSFSIYFILEYRKIKSRPSRLEDKIVQISARNTPIQDVLKDIAHQIGAVAAIGSGFQGTISMDVEGTVSEVLHEICRAKNCQWQILSKEGQGPALFVAPLTSAPTK